MKKKKKSKKISFMRKKNDKKKPETSKYNKKDLIQGKFISNPRGFGFVEVEDREKDFFIPPNYTGNAFNNDIVEVIPLKGRSGEREEAKVVNVVERAKTVIVGTFEVNKGFAFVRPDNFKFTKDVFVPQKYFSGAKSNDKVVLEIYDYGDDNHKPEGKVISVIGGADEPGNDILSIAMGYDIPIDFKEKVLQQAKTVSQPVSQADIDWRRDLRELQTVTIDGEDTKDFDDAISARALEDGNFEIGVHIADVANYVQEGSALDKEALKRGTSVYLVDRVIPMLPFELSNGICSLNENEDRLTLSCIMKFNKDGEVLDYEILESVIRVDKRLTYNQVEAALVEKDKETIKELNDYMDMLKILKRLAKKLYNKRVKRGAIEFNFKECYIVLDENKVAVDIKERARNTATNIIEEFMIVTNETVAEHFQKNNIPFVYRVHENPDEDKVNNLTEMAKKLGFMVRAPKEGITSKQINNLLKKVEGTDEETIINKLALRSLKQAAYSSECKGHFGLASEYYCHFTSPIRRYPDLQIHRIIREYLHKKLNDNRISHYDQILPAVAQSASDCERRADEIEREVEKMKKAEYMTEHIGEVFEGTISGVTPSGIYVELENTVEGMVRVADMIDDYYEYDEENYRFIGTTFRKEYKLGDPVKVGVVSANKYMHTIDFEIVNQEVFK